MARKKKSEGRVFTVVTKLDPAHNQEIIDAFEKEAHIFNQAKIRTFHHIRALAMNGISFGDDEKKKWNTALQHEFRICKRTANSIITEAGDVWTMRAEAEKARLEADQLRKKSIEKEITELTKKKEKAIPLLTGEKPLRKKKKESQEEYQARSRDHYEKEADLQRKRRSRLVSLKKKLNRLNARIEKQKKSIETNNFRICFGTKKLRASDGEAFREWRDHQMSFTGSCDETAQNGIFQLYYSGSRNQFDILMRKDFGALAEG